MSLVKIVKSDLLLSNSKYIAHQCNCVTNVSANLAKHVFSKFPHADIYKNKSQPDTPRNIIIKGNGHTERFVINILGQVYPGKPKYPNSTKDGYLIREEYFQKCLDEILKIPHLESISFPYMIGCGAAGGSWINYRKRLKEFSLKTNADVFVCMID